MSKLVSISQCITEVEPDKLYPVRYLNGAPEILVSCREFRGHYVGKSRMQRKRKSDEYYAKRSQGYETNREIKIWSVFFLLKAMSTSPCIKNWRKQKTLLSTWLQMSEKTFYTKREELLKKKLITVDRNHNIHLCSWEKAAEILDIAYTGTSIIQFNPYKHEGQQSFQYLLRGEEIKANQMLQHKALMNKLEKNHLLRDDLLMLLIRQGADDQRLVKDQQYFRERLLQLQLQLFKQGSDILSYAFAVRADINRGIKKIQDHHKYKSKQSVSYMKHRMAKLQVISVKKVKIISEARARLYVPKDSGDGQRDGYKYFKDQKQTALILTDQITLNYESSKPGQRMPEKKKAA